MASNSAVVGGLHAFLGIDTAEFDKGLDRARNKLKDFKPAQGVSTAIQSLERTMGATAARGGVFADSLVAMGGAAVGAGVAVGGLAAALAGARQAMTFADDIADTAAKLAVSTDALQEYRYAVHALGGSYEDADAALAGFAKAFGAAQAGLSAKALKPFEALGLDPKAFKTTEEALQAVIDKIAGLGSTAQQAAIADKLGLSSILPALREGGDRIEALRAKAQDLGVVMDAELVKRAGDLNDKFETAQQVIDVQMKSALVDAAPALVSLIGFAAELAKMAQAAADAFRSIDNKSEQGLRSKLAQYTEESTRLGLKQLRGGGVFGKAERDRLTWLGLQIQSIKGELADREAANAAASKPTGSGTLNDVTGRSTNRAHASKALTEEQKRLAEAERAAAREAEANEAALTSLLANGLSPSVKYAQEAAEKMRVLDWALKEGRITQAAYEEETAKLNNGILLVAQSAPAAADGLKHVTDLVQDTDFEPWNEAIMAAASAFYGVESAANAAFRAIGENDWIGAIQAISVAIVRLAETFKTAKTSAEKFSAVMGLVSAAGNAVGGVGGATISGAASGAAAGASMASALLPAAMAAGPVGWAIAGVSALVGGFLGNSSATAQKKAAAQQAALQAYQQAMQAANQKREMELHLMELQGKSAEALAQRRADELAAMDASVQAIQTQIWALEDQAEAQAKLEQITSEQNALVDSARNDLSAAYEREASALQKTIDTFTELAASLRDYGKSLKGGSAGNLSRSQILRASGSEFDALAAAVGRGDTSVLGSVEQVSQTYLDALKNAAPDKRTYDRGVARVIAVVAQAEKLAEDQVSMAEAQLAELKTIVSVLITINGSVLSVAAAVANLAAAQAAAADAIAKAQAAATSNDNAAMWTPEGYAAKNPDVAAWAQSVIGQKGYDGQVITSYEDALNYHWLHHGRGEGRAFAQGGDFQVGGFGGIDSQLMAFRASPGEMVHVTHGDRLGELTRSTGAAMAAANANAVELAGLRREMRELVRINRSWDGVGLPATRAV